MSKSEDCRCNDCGRYMRHDPLSGSWAHQYDFSAMCLDYVHWRCADCTRAKGPILSNARPHNGDMNPYEGRF